MKVCLDSRTIKPGEYFVAIKGERFDGHAFVPEALKKRARGVLEEQDLYRLAKEKIDTLKPLVIAITGSYGKTATKEMVYRVLSTEFRVHRTRGNLNTPIGVSSEVVNGLKPKHQIFVAEVGMDRLGEISKTCAIIKPKIGIITAVGEMHLEKLGTLRNIKKAKTELLEALPKEGMAILNYDDPNVREIARSFGGKKVWYGLSKGAQLGPRDIKGLRLKLLGKVNFSNALAAYAVGRYFKIPRGKIFRALESLKPMKGRLHLLKGKKGSWIIDDTYNAGPRSMKEALDILSEFPAKRRVAILGDMLELGDREEKSHQEVIRYALARVDLLIPIGERMKSALHTLLYEEKGEGKVISFNQLTLQEGDVILVKGSRGMKMEEVVNHLLSWKK